MPEMEIAKDKNGAVYGAKPDNKAENDLSATPYGSERTDDSEIAGALKTMPEPMRQIILAMTKTTSRRLTYHPLFDKFTPAHTTQFLENIRLEDQQDYKLRSSNRWFNLVYGLSAIAFLLFLIVFLSQQDKDLLTKIIELLIVFGGGFGAGYGFKSRHKNGG